MTATDPQTIADAEQLGRRAALDGSPTRVLAIAYRRGYRHGELEQGDADGDLFRGQAK
jgi:hypothetical protein